MKYLFSVTALILILASTFTYYTVPDDNSSIPIIRWVTDPNPARNVQINQFEKWLVQNGYTTKDGKPICKVEVDSANNDISKLIIQGVSGVGDTILQIAGSDALQQLHAIGIVEDVTSAGKKLGFAPSTTWPGIAPQITIDGKQYMYPANVAAPLLWVNKQTFEKFNQPLPPKRWNFKEFEKRGKAFVKAANKGLPYQQYFYSNSLNRPTLYRSLGLSFYNETLTKCDLNDPRYVRILKLLYKWKYVDHILPTKGDQSSFATQPGYGGASAQLFNEGNYAMMYSGRYMLIQFRKFTKRRIEKGKKPMQLAVVEIPNGGFANCLLNTRAAGVYKGATKQEKKYGELFLAYLASKRYNMTIIRDADALPPGPKYTKIAAYKNPPKYPNEWGAPNTAFSNAARTIGIGTPNSPFVLSAVSTRIENDAFERYMNNRMTAKQAATTVASRVNAKIKQRLQQDPALVPLYKKRLKLQKKIDKYRAEGKKIPASWIKNMFYRTYYKKIGWLKKDK